MGLGRLQYWSNLLRKSEKLIQKFLLAEMVTTFDNPVSLLECVNATSNTEHDHLTYVSKGCSDQVNVA